MTGEELTATLMRHGVEVLGCDGSATMRGQHIWRITVRDVAGVGDLEAMLPHNVEMTLQRQSMEVDRHHFMGSSDRYVGFSPTTREVRVSGRNPDGLTSPPLTARQLGAAVMPERPVSSSGMGRSTAAQREQAETLQATPPRPILRSFNAADLRRAISSDYEIAVVTPLRRPAEPNQGRYLVEVRLLEQRGYRCSTTNLPRGVTVRYDISDGGARDAEVPGAREDLIADLSDSPVLRWPLTSVVQGQRADLLIIDDIIESPATLTLDSLTSTLPTLFPGGEPRITGVKRASGRDGVFTVSVQLGKVAGSTASAAAVASALPSNVVLAVTTQAGTQREFRGTGAARLESPAQRRATKKPVAPTAPPPPPTRFNLLDLDDGLVTAPTTVIATLKRGTKPPTAAQVRKFRDAFEGRSSTSAAEAAKVANFGDDEVAQHLLVSWCGGLSDDEAAAMLTRAHREVFTTTLASLDTWAQRYRRQNAATLDPDSAADPSTTIAAWHAEQQRRHARAAELRIKTVQRVAEAAQQPSRWDLLELDGAVLPPADELRVKSAPKHIPRPVAVKPWQPPAVTTQHIDVVLPAPTVDYVDVSMLPAEMHGAAVLSCLLDEASRRVGAVKGN